MNRVGKTAAILSAFLVGGIAGAVITYQYGVVPAAVFGLAVALAAILYLLLRRR